jgi:hypothetical protein
MGPGGSNLRRCTEHETPMRWTRFRFLSEDVTPGADNVSYGSHK